jgi:hypothetical protein
VSGDAPPTPERTCPEEQATVTAYQFEPSDGPAFLPVPRVPASASAAWPPAELVAGVHKPVAAAVVDADRLRQELAAAIAALESGRPGGADWRAARQADRQLLVDAPRGRAPAVKSLAALMGGEAGRYALALALASTVSERLDRLRAQVASDAMIGAVDERRATVAQDMSAAAAEAAQAAEQGTKSAGYAALERFDSLVAEQRQLAALRRWVTGETTAFDPSPPVSVPTQVFDQQDTARRLLAGGHAHHQRPADRVAAR